MFLHINSNGNTLVNIADSSQSNISSELKGWKLNSYSDKVATLNLKIDMLKPNTEYTVVFIGDMNQISGSATTLQNVTENNNDVIGSSTYYNKYKYKIRTNSLVHDSNKTHPIYLIPHVYPLEGKVFTQTQLDNLDLKVMVFEGDLTDTETPDEYFFGIKSVGELENNILQLNFQNKNLFNINDTPKELGWGNKSFERDIDNNRVSYISQNGWHSIGYYFKRLKNKRVTVSAIVTCINNDESKSEIQSFNITNKEWDATPREIFRSGETKKVVRVVDVDYNGTIWFLGGSAPEGFSTSGIKWILEDIQIEETLKETEYKKIEFRNQDIYIKNSIRSLPNGVKDRIIKRNGQWVIERNIGESIYDGSENWVPVNENYKDNNLIRLCTERPKNSKKPVDNYERNYAVADKLSFPSDSMDAHSMSLNKYSYSCYFAYGTGTFSIILPEDALESFDDYGFKNWLQNNPVKIVYQLVNPIYEPIVFDSLPLYLDTTHISTNSTIPANLKVTVDRVANRAKESSELAKENPTLYNISLARMWINLMRESILKDEFHDTIDTITEIEDMVLEKKTASANMDLYIKSENLLSLSLNTNSISFDDFSGVEDIVKESAVNISINSSLPYNLNAYLPTEIQNSDKSNTMNLDILSIRENSELNYQKFSAINNKLILKSNCESGNNKQHNIDLKLNGNIAHAKDVYKTTIKFEAEQL